MSGDWIFGLATGVGLGALLSAWYEDLAGWLRRRRSGSGGDHAN